MTPGEKFTLTATDNGWLIEWTNLAGIKSQMVFGSQRRLLSWMATTVTIADLVDEEYWDQPSYRRRAVERNDYSAIGASEDPPAFTTAWAGTEPPSAGLEPSGGTFGGGGASGTWDSPPAPGGTD